MKLPNKLFAYNESIISKFPIVLKEVEKNRSISFYALYINVINKFDDISEFLQTLDCLYALGKISYDYKLRRISYVI